MTARRDTNGDFVMSKALVAVLGLVFVLIGILVGAGIAWGTILSDVAQLQASQENYVQQGTFDATLGRIDASLTSIDKRLTRIEDEGRGR